MKTQVAACAAFLLSSSLCMGAPAKRVKRVVKPVNGAYVLVQGGISKIDYVKTNLYKNWSPSIRLGAGYMFNKTFGIETSYLKFAKYTYKKKAYTQKWGGSSVSVLGVVRYPLRKKLTAFGKGGVSYMTQEAGRFWKHHNFRPEMQLGVSYKVKKNVAATIAYDGIYGKRDQREVSKLKTFPIHSVLFGLNYSFV